MNLSLHHNGVADFVVRGVTLRPAVGAFDLVLMAEVAASKPEAMTGHQPVAHWLRIDGVEAHVQPRGGGRKRLTTLSPRATTRFEQRGGAFKEQIEFQAQLSPRQLLALEDERDGGALALTFQVCGVGGPLDDGVGRIGFCCDVFHTVAQSDWVAALTGAGAYGVVLVETSLPLSVGGEGDEDIGRRMHVAERAFHNGDYQKCVGDCRAIYDRLGLKWSPKGKLQQDDKAMTFSERTELLIASARFCTQLAHHDDGDGLGDHPYTRDEARLLLQVTAAAASFWLRR